MGASWTLIRRELGGYFLSLTGYIILAAASFLMGLSFVVLLKALQQEPTSMPVTEMFYSTSSFWFILVLTTPVITMRLFALEKFSGTFETLMTAPISDLQVVMAKFTAAMIFYMVMWLPLLGCVFAVRHFSGDVTPFDAGTLGATFLGILLLGGLFISLGCCASALTRSQVTAAMMGLALGASLFLLGYLANQPPVQATSTWQTEALACFSFFEQMRDFSRGVVDTRSVVLFVSLTLFFLFLTLRIVESRRWK
jgi:ABC-2 type transport system permease protein